MRKQWECVEIKYAEVSGMGFQSKWRKTGGLGSRFIIMNNFIQKSARTEQRGCKDRKKELSSKSNYILNLRKCRGKVRINKSQAELKMN